MFCGISHVHSEDFYYKEVIEVIDESSSRATSAKTAKKTGYFANDSTISWSVIVTINSNDSRWITFLNSIIQKA